MRLFERASGTVALSVSDETITEGTPDTPGDATVTWTLTAVTAKDEAPEASLDFGLAAAQP